MPDLYHDLESSIDQISAYEFEHLVADIWEKEGWDATVTQSSQDKGIDVVADRRDPVKLRALVQVKAYNQDNKVGSEEVRNYATLYEQEDNVDVVVIATSGWFTKQAVELADELNVRLNNRSDIIASIQSLRLETYSKRISPMNSIKYDIEGVPERLGKVCPVCDTENSIWQASIPDTRELRECSNCEVAWMSDGEGSWQIDEDPQGRT
ncbi:restriction endonuclease [Halomicroarcula sp. F28]|uniref:restriction endonuclease n=1 Tax=Haloarcula salinisoli TaxID=2487746 RepID=UPI001C72A091|nr:restriction endonuclease [Halomicroarcula salinisoli]MBX0287956.1 restriction endonuclease [Halomicroarcula salinisoli]